MPYLSSKERPAHVNAVVLDVLFRGVVLKFGKNASVPVKHRVGIHQLLEFAGKLFNQFIKSSLHVVFLLLMVEHSPRLDIKITLHAKMN